MARIYLSQEKTGPVCCNQQHKSKLTSPIYVWTSFSKVDSSHHSLVFAPYSSHGPAKAGFKSGERFELLSQDSTLCFLKIQASSVPLECLLNASEFMLSFKVADLVDYNAYCLKMQCAIMTCEQEDQLAHPTRNVLFWESMVDPRPRR